MEANHVRIKQTVKFREFKDSINRGQKRTVKLIKRYKDTERNTGCIHNIRGNCHQLSLFILRPSINWYHNILTWHSLSGSEATQRLLWFTLNGYFNYVFFLLFFGIIQFIFRMPLNLKTNIPEESDGNMDRSIVKSFLIWCKY